MNTEGVIFDASRKKFMEQIDTASFKGLEPWEQSGITKRVDSLIQTFKEKSDSAVEPNADSTHLQELPKINKELKRLNGLLDKLDISQDSDKVNKEWRKIQICEEKRSFGGDETSFQAELKKRVNKAIEAHIVKHDGSFLRGKDERANATALKQFNDYSEHLAKVEKKAQRIRSRRLDGPTANFDRNGILIGNDRSNIISSGGLRS